MRIQAAWQKVFLFFGEKPVVVEPSAGQLTSDAGLLPIRQFDQQIGLTQQFAEVLHDSRHQPFVDHPVPEMVRSRVYGILADYADQNDHDVLRSDPVFKLIAGRSPDDDDLASQPTLSRFENMIDIASFWRLRDVLVDQFIASFETPPARLTFDIDTFDDPTHGEQQLTLFHGFYGQYQYLPRAVTCADNDLVVMVCLLHGTAHAALGADDDLEYLVGRLRTVWPDVDIELRGDSGFGVPAMYEVCERLGVWYTFGLTLNPVLKRNSDALLSQALDAYEQTQQKQRLFDGFWYQADSWSRPRYTIVKCEAHARGTNRRVVITNRLGAQVLPGATYDEYVERGESENRNKELKCGVQADRLSDHRYLANLFRLSLHTTALNLLVRLRRELAAPPPAEALETLETHEALDRPDDVPVKALAEPKRRRYFNRRRERDPLGEGQPGTWRTRLIKVAAEIITSSRRVLVRLSSNWPYLNHYRQVSEAVIGMAACPPAKPP